MLAFHLYQMNKRHHKHALHYFCLPFTSNMTMFDVKSKAEAVVDIHTDVVCLWECVGPCPLLR